MAAIRRAFYESRAVGLLSNDSLDVGKAPYWESCNIRRAQTSDLVLSVKMTSMNSSPRCWFRNAATSRFDLIG